MLRNRSTSPWAALLAGWGILRVLALIPVAGALVGTFGGIVQFHELLLLLHDADYYSANCHKWLCAPKGAGFLYVRRELQRDVHPLMISWGYKGDDPAFVARHEKQGTRDPSAYLTDALARFTGLKCHADFERMLAVVRGDFIAPSVSSVSRVQSGLSPGL